MVHDRDPMSDIVESPLDDNSRRPRVGLGVVAGLVTVLVGVGLVFVTRSGDNPTATTASQPRTVPDLRGLSLSLAVERAEAAGYDVVSDEPTSDGSQKVVFTQTPGPGENEPAGATIRVQTSQIMGIGCAEELQDVGPPSIDVPATFGGVTLVGFRKGRIAALAEFPSPEDERFPMLFIPTQLDAGVEPVWLYIRDVRADPPVTAGLLFVLQTVFDTRMYRLEDAAEAVMLERCHTDKPTRYVGGIVFEGPACVSIWLYEGSIASEPTVLDYGIGTAC